MHVLKFGGSSIASADRILRVVDLLVDRQAKGDPFCVVFSAFGGVTDALLSAALLAEAGDPAYEEQLDQLRRRHLDTAANIVSGEVQRVLQGELTELFDTLASLLQGIYLVREASKRTIDYVLSFGERSSCKSVARALQERGCNAQFLDAREIIKTDKRFGSATVRTDATYENIVRHFKTHGGVQVVTGFIASTAKGLTTTLGRGGSDYTAALLAGALQADRIEIWTDVDGVMTADPRAVRRAFTIPRLTYGEAMEMSHFGAKVIYPPTLQPIIKREIPLYIRNTFRPEHPGTLVAAHSDDNGRTVKGISSIRNISLLTLEGSGLFGVVGISGRLFGALAQADVNVVLITQGSSEHSITFAVQPVCAPKARAAVEKTFAYEMEHGLIRPVKLEHDLSVVAVIGERMRFQPGIAGRLFQALGRNGINCVAVAQGSSELNISVVVQQSDEAKALNALHDAFFLSDQRDVHVFLLGTGLIASALMKQMEQQVDRLRETKRLNIRLVGLTNTRRMVFNPEGLALGDWQTQLAEKGQKADLDSFVAQAIELNLNNSIFVDCSASSDVAALYERLLAASISISTPNKVATSSNLERYHRLKRTAAQHSAVFAYETNVGAGLPVLSTLHDLSASGDEITRIDGVLSGSLSYIFNTFDGSKPFSAVVADAREQGFTEPDPRLDLSGKDVCRKIVILAREAGFDLELDDVQVQADFISDASFAAESVDDFFERVRRYDDAALAKRVEAVTREGKRLVMLASYSPDSGATVRLEAVGTDNPFYSLSGSDNMIVFTTARYRERPLMVRGPGAGADVTAAGVFAEIISIGNLRSWE